MQHFGQWVTNFGFRLAFVVTDQIAVFVVGQNLAGGQVINGGRTAACAG